MSASTRSPVLLPRQMPKRLTRREKTAQVLSSISSRGTAVIDLAGWLSTTVGWAELDAILTGLEACGLVRRMERGGRPLVVRTVTLPHERGGAGR